MATRGDRRSRHEQIAAEIRAAIMAGDLSPGEQLPSIPTLVTTYSAATATVQRALAALKDEGYLISAVGKGVYVREREPLLVEVAAYWDPARSRYSYRLLDVAETEAPPEVGRALQLAEGERVIVRHRLALYDTDPVELSWSYYRMSIAAGTELTQQRRIVGGAPRVLSDAGLPMVMFADRVSARMPTPEETELLALPPNVPVIRQFRVVASRNDRPVEASILVKGGHLHELHYRQTVDQGDGR
ncbi:transcriptional regulator, GntR family [Micromonospora pallida]|uniref:Transcriptional regulator, GntR family n=1 Tax=Micromonospora pallida TaxID=145854 RepID=A0A1C6T9F2_9ACTN|nr:GntR family transcriptional regulator [Micromonospora pallida]SCL38212.1 transcriptional regulator, GntR family [Micromonospora pallida]